VNIDHDGDTGSSMAPQIFCKACSSPLVQATDWAEEEDGWRARVWCPECGFEHEAVLAKAEVAYLSLAVEGGFACLLEALAELEDMPNGGFARFDPVARMRSEKLAQASL
jgi:hypothetical protein